MRDPKRIWPMLKALEKLMVSEPDMRLGQWIVNLVSRTTNHTWTCPEVFYVEDDKLMKEIQNWNDRGVVDE